MIVHIDKLYSNRWGVYSSSFQPTHLHSALPRDLHPAESGDDDIAEVVQEQAGLVLLVLQRVQVHHALSRHRAQRHAAQPALHCIVLYGSL